LDELLITLHCRHTFTVETLDGHCDLNAFYDRETGADGTDGRWLGLAVPPHGFLNPKTCPTCRGPILAARYGRASKRADLDILERNVASNMSREIRHVHELARKRSSNDLEAELISKAVNVTISKTVSTPAKRAKREKGKNAVLIALGNIPCPSMALHVGNPKLFHIPSGDIHIWKSVTQELLVAYQKAVDVASTRSSHIHAWEAAFTSLYSMDKTHSLARPERAPRNVEKHAMRAATTGVGHPRPRADSRFRVEAYWQTLQIRFLLADLARAWLEQLTKVTPLPLPEHCQEWAGYISFILQSCLADASIAQEIAEESESRRQVTKTSLMILRGRLEQFRFTVFMTQRTQRFLQHRDMLLENAEDRWEEARTLADSTCMAHRDAKGFQGEEEETWLASEFIAPALKITEQWEALVRSIRTETFYQPLSLEEMTDIVKAMDFSTSFHVVKECFD
jgi:hypothetical protein